VRVSPSPALPVEGLGPLGFPGRPASDAPRANTPPDTQPPCPLSVTVLLPSDGTIPWASGIVGRFEAGGSLARMFTYLRINRRVIATAARLVTGLPGSALAGRDSHPLDDSSDFQKVSPSLLPVGPGLPDRFRPSTLSSSLRPLPLWGPLGTGHGDFRHPALPLPCLAGRQVQIR
jgi:hypothetical protein